MIDVILKTDENIYNFKTQVKNLMFRNADILWIKNTFIVTFPKWEVLGVFKWQFQRDLKFHEW